MTKKLFLLLMALLPMTMYSQSDKIYDMADPMPSFPGGLVELFHIQYLLCILRPLRVQLY